MWIIESKNSNARYYMLPEKRYVVGRKDCQILLTSDAAISRTHATLIVSSVTPTTPIPRTTLTVEDQSKFGTFVNGVRISPQTSGKQIQLKDGDEIKFGSEKSAFSVWHEDLVFTTSCLESSMKRSVRTLLKSMGACLVADWNNYCSLIIMSKLNVTIKVICALISNKPIVTPEYLVELHKAFENHTTRPQTKQFLPSLAESQVNPEEVSFEPNGARATLFRGMKFIFLTEKQFQRLHGAIELAGGHPILMAESVVDDRKQHEDMLVQVGSCVMYSEMGDTQDYAESQHRGSWIGHVLNLLRQNRKRPIPEAELGYAVLYCSVEKYCNPNVIPQGDQFYPSVPSIPAASLSQAPVPVSTLTSDPIQDYIQQAKETSFKVPGTMRPSEAGSTHLESEPTGTTIIGDDSLPTRKRPRDSCTSSPGLPPLKVAKQQTVSNAHAQTLTQRSAAVISQPPQSSSSDLFAISRPAETLPADSAATSQPVSGQPVSGQPVSGQPDYSQPDIFSANLMTPSSSRIFDGYTSGKASTIFCTSQDNLPATSSVVDDEFDTSRVEPRRLDTKTDDFGFGNGFDDSAPPSSSSLRRGGRDERSDEPVDEFDIVPSSRKSRRQQRTPQTPVPPAPVIRRPPVPDTIAAEAKDTVILLLDTETNNHFNAQRNGDHIVSRQNGTEKAQERSAQDDGFLTAKRAPPLMGKVKMEAAESDSEPRNCIIVKCVSLLRRGPKSTNADGDFNMWNNKRVKNFKKFRKAGTSGAADGDVVRLPRIIGGSDLVAHRDLAKRTQMAKLAKDLEEQCSQNEAADREAMELFDLVPTANRKGRK